MNGDGTIQENGQSIITCNERKIYHRPSLPSILAHKKSPVKSGAEKLFPNRYNIRIVNNGRLTLRNNEFNGKKIKEHNFRYSGKKSLEQRRKSIVDNFLSSSLSIVKIK